MGLGYGFNGPLAASGMTQSVGLTSVRVMENYGYLARLTVGTLVAMTQRDKEYVGSTYGYDYRIDYYRSLTPEEQAAQARALDDALSGNYIMELSVYAPGFLNTHAGKPQGRGFEFYLGGTTSLGMFGNLPSVLQMAFVMSHMAVNGMPFKEGEGPHAGAFAPGSGNHLESVYYTNFGLMLRVILPLNRVVEAYGQWDLNALSLFNTSGSKLKSDGYLWTSPLRLGLLLNATDRFFLRGYGSLNGFGGYGLGGAADAGFRF